MWFQHDDAPAHFAVTVQGYFCRTFGSRSWWSSTLASTITGFKSAIFLFLGPPKTCVPDTYGIWGRSIDCVDSSGITADSKQWGWYGEGITEHDAMHTLQLVVSHSSNWRSRLPSNMQGSISQGAESSTLIVYNKNLTFPVMSSYGNMSSAGTPLHVSWVWNAYSEPPCI